MEEEIFQELKVEGIKRDAKYNTNNTLSINSTVALNNSNAKFPLEVYHSVNGEITINCFDLQKQKEVLEELKSIGIKEPTIFMANNVIYINKSTGVGSVGSYISGPTKKNPNNKEQSMSAISFKNSAQRAAFAKIIGLSISDYRVFNDSPNALYFEPNKLSPKANPNKKTFIKCGFHNISPHEKSEVQSSLISKSIQLQKPKIDQFDWKQSITMPNKGSIKLSFDNKNYTMSMPNNFSTAPMCNVTNNKNLAFFNVHQSC